MSKKPPPSFFSRYLVTIVMIPTIIGLHFGWSLMQKNRTLVSEVEEIELPVITFTKYIWKKLNNSAVVSPSTQENIKTVAVEKP